MSAANSDDPLKSASADVGRYAALAGRYCEKKFGSVEGNEAIFAAILLAITIRETSADITNALDDISSEIKNADPLDISGIESALDELIKAVDNVAHHIN